MNIVKPYAEIQTISGFRDLVVGGRIALEDIERYARVSHRSEERITPDSWRRFIYFVVLEKGDWSVTEHVLATVEFLVDRGITHEIVRHRIASYTQESTRFCNYGKKDGQITVIEPPFNNPLVEQKIWYESVAKAEQCYLRLLEVGVSPQIARSVLPNSLASKIICTMNLRTWRHFFMMRTTQEAHPQMRQVTIPLLEDFKKYIPLLYDDLVPEQKQSISLARVK